MQVFGFTVIVRVLVVITLALFVFGCMENILESDNVTDILNKVTTTSGCRGHRPSASTVDHRGDLVIILPGNTPLAVMHIPAGTYMRGAYPGEQDAWDYAPQHEVTLTQDFFMGKFLITKRQWQAIMGTTPWTERQYVLNDPDSPAVYVSWNDVQDFMTALNRHIEITGQGPATFRLPTDAEWEYACRAGTTTRFYWGDDPDYTQINDYAWYKGNTRDTNRQYAHVVGLKLPNEWGLYDMSGNVREWCQDMWADYGTDPVTDPTGPTVGSLRVARSGIWNSVAHFCRSARRSNFPPTSVQNGLGFRLARTL